MSRPECTPDRDRLMELLYGRKVVRVVKDPSQPESWSAGPTGWLYLDDGTVLKVWGNDGGCACSAGCYPLARLAEFDNAITNVEVDYKPDAEDWGYNGPPEERGFYRVHVFGVDTKAELLSCEGSDGNGYYGTGWWLQVQDERIIDGSLVPPALEV